MGKHQQIGTSRSLLAVAGLFALGALVGVTLLPFFPWEPSPAFGQGYSATPASNSISLQEPTSVSQVVGPEGGTIALRGGIAEDGGMSVVFPPGSLAGPVKVTLAVADTPPAGASASGGELLPKTIDIQFDQKSVLRGSYEFQVNLTAAELGTRSLESIKGAWVRPDGLVATCPTAVLDGEQAIIRVVSVSTTKFTLFSLRESGPALTTPEDGAKLAGLGTTLSWALPAGATQYQLWVHPFNLDGPGINLVRQAETSYTIPPPDISGLTGNYVMLPDMTYLWRIRSTASAKPPEELTIQEWTAWSIRVFRTGPVTSSTVSLVSPDPDKSIGTLTPTLTWRNTDKAVFYYEVQVSKDPNFSADPGAPFLYRELVHGGMTDPSSSYTIPSGFPWSHGRPSTGECGRASRVTGHQCPGRRHGASKRNRLKLGPELSQEK